MNASMRRVFLAALAAIASTGPALAAEYPSRPVRLIVPFPPGGSGDFQGRVLGPQLSEQLKQQVVVDNRGGANGAVAHELVAKGSADGHTLLLGFMSALTINPALYKKLTYDTLKDFTPVTMTARTTLCFVANASLPASTVKELIALAKASPGKIAYGSTGVGNGTHLAVEMLQSAAGIKLVHVPYKGAGPALIDVIGGQVAIAVVTTTAALPQARAGKLKVLMVATKERAAVMPEVPSSAEVGFPELDIVNGWFGVLVQSRTPKAIVARLHEETVKALQKPDVQTRFVGAGLDPKPMTPEEFAAVIKSDLARWAKVVKDAGIRAE